MPLYDRSRGAERNRTAVRGFAGLSSPLAAAARCNRLQGMPAKEPLLACTERRRDAGGRGTFVRAPYAQLLLEA
jgi:hypothetical protein